jgi:hypothetical protein
MAYSGQAEQVFQDALVSAFPTYESVEQLVRLLDVNLAEISRRGNLRDVVFDVVRWADRENRVPQLVRTAAAEQPGNPRLQRAVRHVDDPLLIEDRWFAKQVPVATWLLAAANVALLLMVVKVYFANLINTFRLLSTLALACLVAVAVWRLYAWLVGAPVRARVGTLLRRLVAHSRLERRDWVAFGVFAALFVFQATAVAAAPAPIVLSFSQESPRSFWKNSEFVVVRSFPNVPSEMELQGPARDGLRDPERFSTSFYRADFFIAHSYTARRVKLRIELLPADADTSGRNPPEGTAGVSFADVAVDRALGAVVVGQGTRVLPDRGYVHEATIELVAGLDEIAGRHTVLFTCQRRLDGQPTPTEVLVYARILDAANDAILFPAEEPFSILNWHSPQVVADRAGPGLHR